MDGSLIGKGYKTVYEVFEDGYIINFKPLDKVGEGRIKITNLSLGTHEVYKGDLYFRDATGCYIGESFEGTVDVNERIRCFIKDLPKCG